MGTSISSGSNYRYEFFSRDAATNQVRPQARGALKPLPASPKSETDIPADARFLNTGQFLRETYARAPTAAGSGVAETALSSPLAFCCCGCPPLRMSMPPLKNAPSSIEIRAAITPPVSEPSLRMSTRSLAVRLPRTLPSTTISRALMLAATTPLRPTVTRLPERLIEPSTRPSIYSDSEPVTSPLITRDLPIVAWSAVVVLMGRGVDGSLAVEVMVGALGVDGVGRSAS